MSTELQLGQRVRYNRTIARTYEIVNDNTMKKLWFRRYDDENTMDIIRDAVDKFGTLSHHVEIFGEGIVTGIRTLQNGTVRYSRYEGDTKYTVDNTFKAYIVTHHLRRKPVYVLPEDLEVIE